jgi:hypothetical protein
VATLALRQGVPLADVAATLKGVQFEPAGFTGQSDIPSVSSIADYLGKWLDSQNVCQGGA